VFLEQIRKQAILDTAMDAMGTRLDGQATTFRISRLAAFAGKSLILARGYTSWRVF
jgi:predicted RNA binding protein with dsRBD fold (UPF0201 family)